MTKLKPVLTFRTFTSWFEDDMRFWDRKLNNFKHLVYKDWDDETPEAAKIKSAIEKVEMANKELLEAILDNQHEVNQEMLNRFKRLGERSYANE